MAFRHRDLIRASAAVAAATLILTAPQTGSAQSAIASWRAQHERQIVDELLQLVSIPNVAGNDADMRRNAELLAALFRRRGFAVETTQGPGSPVILATLDVPSFDPQWRVYGRSASDDKGPIIALLNAVDALGATGSRPAWNLRVVLDGEEEAILRCVSRGCSPA